MSLRPTQRRTLLLALVAALALPAAARADVDLSITDTAFVPTTVTIQRGDSVTWVNDGTKPHTVTSDDGTTMESGLLEPWQSFATLFKTAGTFHYRSTAPGDTMQGTVVVKPGELPTATGPTPPAGTVPPGVTPQPGSTSATSDSSDSSSGTDWSTVGLVVGAGLVVAAAVVLTLVVRRARRGGA